ncbi:hypothetical protein Scep_007385 [Stephania cephalantha]|uniref:Uncharacterized protein n=1 Tax=Stephania cephalantha TaxID=152367 RepID=A0AAP0PL17_9MAGN
MTFPSSLSLSPLSLTEISLPNPKSLLSFVIAAATRPSALLSSPREIGASEALSRRRPTPHPKTFSN